VSGWAKAALLCLVGVPASLVIGAPVRAQPPAGRDGSVAGSGEPSPEGIGESRLPESSRGSTGEPGASASAQLERARELYREGEVERARSRLEAAKEAHGLERGQLATLLETEVLIHRLRGDERAAQRAIERLASLAPAYDFAAEVPPAVRRAFRDAVARSEGPPRLSVEAQRSPSGVRVEARAIRDPHALVERVEVHARAEPGRWVDGRGQVLVAASPTVAVAYFARAIGPGGAVLAEVGTRADPRIQGPVVDEDAASSEPSPWRWVGLAAGIAVLAGTAAALAVTLPEADRTQLSAPTPAWR
jgi:hypothetical protein